MITRSMTGMKGNKGVLVTGFDNVILPLVVLDRNFNYINVNKAFLNACGKVKKDILGHNHFEFFPSEEKHAIFSEVVRTKKSYQSFAEPFRFTNPPGSSYWDLIINPVLDDNGNIESIVVSFKDVTKQKAAEEELRKSEEAYRKLFELNVVGLFRRVYDPVSGLYELFNCNDAYARILGYGSPDEIMGTSFEIHIQGKGNWNRYIKSLVKDRIAVNFRTKLKKRNGKLIWVLINASARDFESGKLLIEGTILDITDQKRTEERLVSTQKKLRAMASEILISDERQRQNFAASLHDSVVQTLGAAKLRSHFLEQYISHNGTDCLTELQDMISQSLTEARALMSELSSPVLSELGLIPALEWLTEQIKYQNKISINIETPNKFPSLTHELEVLLFQATRELFTNIVKHARATETKIRVSAKENTVQVEVIDNGIGFDRNKMFNTDSSGGYGLFSIRERLIHLGGRLRIQSKPDKGSRIVIQCPTSGGGGGNHTLEEQQQNTP